MITQQITINDEPLVAESTGKRTATLSYRGPQYIYIEVDKATKIIQSVIYRSDTSDSKKAKEFLTKTDAVSMAEIDAAKNLVLAAHLAGQYTLQVQPYEETLSTGDLYRYEYPAPVSLTDIFNFTDAKFNLDSNDLESYKFITTEITNIEMIKTVDNIIAQVKESLEKNTFSEGDSAALTKYIAELEEYKKKCQGPDKHWKFVFPANPVPF